tara:strand:+ start:71 stop:982 length:912 start_codon:yes stop_codon:yes gene_type:complete
MLCLSEMPTMAEGRLCRAVPRRDGTGEIAWDVDISFNMMDEGEAETANHYVPGALQAWQAGQDGSKGSVKSSSGYDLLHVTLTDESLHANGETQKLASGHADIRHCVVNVNGSEAAMVIRLRIHGLLPHAAAGVVYKLDEVVTLQLDTHQLHLFDAGTEQPASQAPTVNPTTLIGRIALVEKGDAVAQCGEVLEENEEAICLGTIESGIVFIKAPYKVASSICVLPQEGFDLPQLIDSYAQAMDKVGGAASWHDLIEAIGLLYAANQIETLINPGYDDFAFELSGAVIKKAITMHADRLEDGV